MFRMRKGLLISEPKPGPAATAVSRRCSWNWRVRCPSPAACALLLLAAASCISQGLADTRNQPWTIFGNALTAETLRVIQARTEDLGGPLSPEMAKRKDLAEAVVMTMYTFSRTIVMKQECHTSATIDKRTSAGIGNLWDGGKRKYVRDFGYGFSGIIYDAVIAQGYASVVKMGDPVPIDRYSKREAENGASLLVGCIGSHLPAYMQDWPVDRLDLPCPHGAAVRVAARTQRLADLICVVFYYPLNPNRRFFASSYLPVFESVITSLMPAAGLPVYKRPGGSVIDLTQLALDIATKLAKRAGKTAAPGCKFRVVAIVPIYRPSMPASSSKQGLLRPDEFSGIGLAAEFGYFAINHCMWKK